MIRESGVPAPEPADKDFKANPNLINRQLAMRSHSGTSFDPEKRGEQEIAEFVSYVQQVYNHLKKHAITDRQKEYLLTEIERFQATFASKYNAKLSAQGGCLSSMIAGPSNFPVRRAEKACSAADKRYEELIEFRDRAEAAILRELKKIGVEEAGGEIEVLKKKIADAERNHEFMVQANVIVRKKIPDDQKIREIMALGKISETTAREILKPDYMGRTGFPDYALSNDTANIRRMKERLKELEKKEVTPTAEIPFTGGYIIDNREADRVQIVFDQRPSPEMINKLKSEGWRWSPANVAWQRKRTQAAMYSASRITGAAQPAPAVQPQVTPAPAPAPAPVAVTPMPIPTHTQPAKYKLGQMVYSYQNPTTAAPIIAIHLSDNPLYAHTYILRIPSREGTGTRNSNNINEESLSETPLGVPTAFAPQASVAPVAATSPVAQQLLYPAQVTPVATPQFTVVKPVQTIQDIRQQVVRSIQDAKSMDELRQILKGLGFLPLPEPEKRQLIDLYQIRLSELAGELKFGERITEEEKKKKRRAPQKVAPPPARRLEEFGVREAMGRRYGYA